MPQNWNKVASSLLVEMLQSENVINQCGIMCELVRRGKHSPVERDALRGMVDNSAAFWNNYLVSDFAIAALDLMGWDKYRGQRKEVKDLISVRLQFD